MTHSPVATPAPALDVTALDRAAGAVLGSAVGDALGAGYEFSLPPAAGTAAMIGGGLGDFEPGEWTDDTSQAVPILLAAAAGRDLRAEDALDEIVDGWLRWYREDARDIGRHTSAVFARMVRPSKRHSSAAKMRLHARGVHAETGRSASNGALMRTGPVALAHLGDRDACAAAAGAIASTTHPDQRAVEAAIVWSEAIRYAVLYGSFDGLRAALDLLPPARSTFWSARLDEAEDAAPGSFGDNGYVVATLQDAWSAIVSTAGGVDGLGSQEATHFHRGVDAAVCAGGDTDTVAAIAGALLGARWGASAVPHRWRQAVHGWPGLDAGNLVGYAIRAARGGADDSTGWPSARSLREHYAEHWHVRVDPVEHPDDPGLLLGTSGTLALLEPGGRLEGTVDAVVSLCRVGRDDVPPALEHLEVWLIDSADPRANPNLAWVLDDTVAAIGDLRARGQRVLLHCVAAESRTPTVAALYGAAVTGTTPSEALRRIEEVLEQADPKAAFRAVLTSRS